MRYLAVFAAALLVAACGPGISTMNDTQTTHPAQEGVVDNREAAPDSVVQALLAAAAEDFLLHGPPGPIRVRDVRFGRSRATAGEVLSLLCGQFLQKEGVREAEWMRFATIKTSGYEQWLGKQADVFCQDDAVVWEEAGDLNAALQSRLDAPR